MSWSGYLQLGSRSVSNKAWEGETGGIQQWSHNISLSSRPIRFDHIFDRPPAYWAARINLSLQLQPTVVAQTHVSAGVDDCVHLPVEADGAFSIFSSRGQFWGREGGRDRGTERGAGSSHWMKRKNKCGLKQSRHECMHRTDNPCSSCCGNSVPSYNCFYIFYVFFIMCEFVC